MMGHPACILTIMTKTPQEVGVAEAKARLSEFLARIGRGERFIVTKRGAATAALVPPDQALPPSAAPLGLAAFAGALADWDDLPGVVDEVYRKRRHARDRDVPDLK
jgi:prevent-host-death family protein